jgi:ADP-ribosylglycohydrolase
MTRREGWRELAKICAELHESRSGAGERLTDEEIAYDLNTLRVALRTWRQPSSAYDEAQRALVTATLAEYGDEPSRSDKARVVLGWLLEEVKVNPKRTDETRNQYIFRITREVSGKMLGSYLISNGDGPRITSFGCALNRDDVMRAIGEAAYGDNPGALSLLESSPGR